MKLTTSFQQFPQIPFFSPNKLAQCTEWLRRIPSTVLASQTPDHHTSQQEPGYPTSNATSISHNPSPCPPKHPGAPRSCPTSPISTHRHSLSPPSTTPPPPPPPHHHHITSPEPAPASCAACSAPCPPTPVIPPPLTRQPSNQTCSHSPRTLACQNAPTFLLFLPKEDR